VIQNKYRGTTNTDPLLGKGNLYVNPLVPITQPVQSAVQHNICNELLLNHMWNQQILELAKLKISLVIVCLEI